jgi:hypothetical protein
MSGNSQTFLETLRVELARQDDELAGLREQMRDLPEDVCFAVPEDALPAAPAELLPLPPTARLRA